MGTVISIAQWRRTRDPAGDAGERRGSGAPGIEVGPASSRAEHPSSRAEPEPLARLERAVARLDDALRGRRLPRETVKWLETELLAVIGALAAGLPDEAAYRAERTAERLRRLAGARGLRRAR